METREVEHPAPRAHSRTHSRTSGAPGLFLARPRPPGTSRCVSRLSTQGWWNQFRLPFPLLSHSELGANGENTAHGKLYQWCTLYLRTGCHTHAGCLLPAALPQAQHPSPIWCLAELSSMTVTSTRGKETTCSQNDMTNEDDERNTRHSSNTRQRLWKSKKGSVTAGNHQ